MTARKLLLASSLALLALSSGAALAGCSAAGPQAAASGSATTGSASPSPSSSPTTTASSPASSASPSSASPSSVSVPVVAPTLRSLQIDGPGYAGALTPEETKARDTIYRVLPVLMNEAAPKYPSPAGARDELLSQGLITAHMASSFPADFTPGQSEVHAAGFTVQTTGMECTLHTSAGSALQTGHVFCYLSRQYMGPDGAPVTDSRWTTPGQPEAIDPNELANASVTMANEGGTWKVDAVQFGA
ncbi:hypothetical protein [Sinomonas humi]|uniref:Lipoprotein n=1 Tax=Sinomonas humi TaxID=1338436 RepID=A0A0B2AFP3_9MICC|nr:hypothetical protein [Sinomonas humi]KHL00507.1 hypothetical protein LK10_20195 [Sinomonas humi]